MKSITYMLILFLLVSQGIQAKAISGEVIEMDEEQLTSLKLHIRKNIEGLALNEEFDAIEVKSYFKGAKQSAFISFKPFETSFEHNRKNVVNCSKEKNNGWSCKKTLITTLLINENGRTVTLMKGNSISEAIQFVNRFLNSESIIVEDEEGKSKQKNGDTHNFFPALVTEKTKITEPTACPQCGEHHWCFIGTMGRWFWQPG
ncbi:hypothetical protein [Aliikangiella sp. IMCC44632]